MCRQISPPANHVARHPRRCVVQAATGIYTSVFFATPTAGLSLIVITEVFRVRFIVPSDPSLRLNDLAWDVPMKLG